MRKQSADHAIARVEILSKRKCSFASLPRLSVLEKNSCRTPRGDLRASQHLKRVCFLPDQFLVGRFRAPKLLARNMNIVPSGKQLRCLTSGQVSRPQVREFSYFGTARHEIMHRKSPGRPRNSLHDGDGDQSRLALHNGVEHENVREWWISMAIIRRLGR